MPLTQDQQDVADQIAARVREQLRVPSTAVTSEDMRKVPCHCNASDCERCAKQNLATLAEVKARHAELYPAILAAEQDATWSARGQREAFEKLQEHVAALTAEIARLTTVHG